MDFVVGLPHSPKGYDSIWVIMDRLMKVAHFLLIKTTYSVAKYAELYIHEIARLHGVPVSIISNWGPQFTSQFYRAFQEAMCTKVNLSATFPLQIDGQSERTI